MDIQKHGEAAYPAQAWIEDQYRKRQQSMYDRKPVHMQGPGKLFRLARQSTMQWSTNKFDEKMEAEK